MSSTATTVKVPFLDLKAQYHSIKPEIDAAIATILEAQPVRPGRGGRRLRARVRGLLRGGPGHRRQLGDERPAPGPPGGGNRARVTR